MVSLRRNKIGEKLNGDRENWCSEGPDTRVGGRRASRSLCGGHGDDVRRVPCVDHDQRRRAWTWPWRRRLGSWTWWWLGPWPWWLGPWPWLGRLVPSAVEQPSLLLLLNLACLQVLTS